MLGGGQGTSGDSRVTAARQTRTVRAIDGLKGVGALGIVVFHMSAALAYSPEFGFTAGWFGKYFLLLDLFFVLSGYGVALGYADTFRERVTARDYGRFLWGRFVRLYPLYLFVLLVLGAQEIVHLAAMTAGWYDPGHIPFQKPTANWWNYLTSLARVQSWGFHNKLVWNIPAWYVSALICAYFVFPFLAWTAARLPVRYRAAAVIAVAGCATVALHIAFQARLFPGPNDMSPLRAVVEFGLGYGIALLKPGPAWRRWLQLPLVVVVFWGLHHGWRDWQILIAMTALLWALLDDVGVAAAFLGSRAMVWLGSISYGIFLVHQPILSWFDALGRSPLAPHLWILWSQHFSWNIALRFVVIVVAGWAAHRYVATPAQRWLQGTAGR